MPRYIVKLDTPIGPRYMEYSTIVDCPVTFGLTLDEFHDYYKEEYGVSGLRDLPDRLERAERKGTSAWNDASAEDTLACNRAGPNESSLTIEEIVEWFCIRRKEPKYDK